MYKRQVQKDAIFIDLLQFVPLLIGILLAAVQFFPEMQRKCLKPVSYTHLDVYKRQFKDIPELQPFAFYAEEVLNLPVNRHKLAFTAGIRCLLYTSRCV